jgi:hypothetical protein
MTVSVQWTVLGTLSLTALLGCGENPRRAESVPVEPLPIAADTIVTPYGEVPQVAWLGGRRWAVVAADHDAAVIADFETKKTSPIGKPTPKEYDHPFGVFTVGDTIYLADWGRRRTTVWTTAGQLLRSFPAPDATRGNQPKARDAAGQFYFEVPPVAGPDGSGNRDSLVIVRSDPNLTRFDTVTRLTPPEVAEVQRNSGKRFERLVFSGVDAWGVRPDGRLWVARINGNRVNTVAGGKENKGESLPDPVLEVTQQDRDAFIQSFPEEVRSTAEDLPFAVIKPPFERAFAGPDGSVWLRKSRAAIDTTRRYQVVDTTGHLARVFQTVGHGVLIGASTDRVLMAEQFKQGVRLMEIRIPAPVTNNSAKATPKTGS